MTDAWFEPKPTPPLPAGVTRFDGLSYGLVPGYRPLLMDVRVPATPMPPPVVVWIHGGGWREGDRRYLPPTLASDSLFTKILDAGLALATVDYRLSAEAPFPAPLHDVKAAVRYLRRFAGPLGIDAGRIGVGGESAGGHLAALVALTPDQDGDLEGSVGVTGPSSAVACAVLWYGFFDARQVDLDDPRDPVIRDLLGGADPALAERASPIRYVTRSAPPALLLHGDADTVVELDQSRNLHEALREAGVDSELVNVPGAEHCFDGYADIDGLLDRSVAFWRDRLATTPG